MQDRPKLLLITNRMSHMRFRLVVYQNHRPWMTDLELLYKSEFSRNFCGTSPFWEATRA